LLGRGFIFTIVQIYYPESVLVYSKLYAPARLFVLKNDTARWKISIQVDNLCSKVEYREIFRPEGYIKDSVLCALRGVKNFNAYAEIVDHNSGKVLKTVKGKNLENKRDILVSSLIYEYVEDGVKLMLKVISQREVSVRFGFKNQWERWKYFDPIKLQGDTLIEVFIPKRALSFGEIRFSADVDGLRRETEILFNEFNIENDKDFRVLLSVLDFVYGKKTDILKKKGDRKENWERFWEEMGGEKAKEAFLERLYTAMYLYPSNLRNKISDRALVYTKFGPPDEILNQPFRFEGKPYEVWYYYRLGLKFVFVDFDGTGDYRMVPESYLDIMR
jgi:GWxTD domain-containing protein